jgi:RNA-binding protein
MVTSKQRQTLSGMGQALEPVFQIGKNGITDTLVTELGAALEARELIKIKILANSDLEPKTAMAKICDALKAEPISCVGGKIVVYRKSSRENFKHIEI